MNRSTTKPSLGPWSAEPRYTLRRRSSKSDSCTSLAEEILLPCWANKRHGTFLLSRSFSNIPIVDVDGLDKSEYFAEVTASQGCQWIVPSDGNSMLSRLYGKFHGQSWIPCNKLGWQTWGYRVIGTDWSAKVAIREWLRNLFMFKLQSSWKTLRVEKHVSCNIKKHIDHISIWWNLPNLCHSLLNGGRTTPIWNGNYKSH